MNDTTTPADGGSEELRAVVTNYGTLSGKSESIPAEHQPFAAQVLKMDPLKDAPGNVHDTGGFRPIALKASALPDDMRGAVQRKLDQLPDISADERAKHESRLVQEAVQAKRGHLRGLTGVGPNALPFHREQANIAMQVQDLYRKRDGFQEAIDKVVDVKKGQDPVTGELIAEPIMWLSATTRRNYENNIADIDRQIRLLVSPDGSFGIEGKKRMEKALRESAAILHQRSLEQANEQAAQKRADEMLREESIEKRAEVIAKMKRGSR